MTVKSRENLRRVPPADRGPASPTRPGAADTTTAPVRGTGAVEDEKRGRAISRE
ncbi:hypothetical protein OG393_31580 [Streptomyces sp. NBC_01216]|uniref:hypothetical protein n=1 Tax=Streptomyces sp. NBC_01216 TaxID=2903778 RepID=UPI002E10BAE7|nr:hypothetical protein OG393_31580 [Streptomyces sp. NBC_01216]